MNCDKKAGNRLTDSLRTEAAIGFRASHVSNFLSSLPFLLSPVLAALEVGSLNTATGSGGAGSSHMQWGLRQTPQWELKAHFACSE